jgi:pimeloyl-ACP methyl ester carboxylesterase
VRHSEHWGPFLEIFKEYFPQDQIELLDTRGNGLQSHVPSYTTIEENVRDLRNRSEFLKQGPINLLTISLGSMMGIQWADRHPDEIQSLICMNTSDGRTSKFYERLQPEVYPKLLKTLVNIDDHVLVEKTIMKIVAPRLKSFEHWISQFAKTPPTSRQNLIRQLIAASHFRLPINKPTCPVLLIGGMADRLVNPKCTTRIGEAWGVKPVWHPLGGHDISIEEPVWVCEQIKQFIQAALQQ